MKPKRYIKEYANDLIKYVREYEWIGEARINKAVNFYRMVVKEYEREWITAREAITALTEYNF